MNLKYYPSGKFHIFKISNKGEKKKSPRSPTPTPKPYYSHLNRSPSSWGFALHTLTEGPHPEDLLSHLHSIFIHWFLKCLFWRSVTIEVGGNSTKEGGKGWEVTESHGDSQEIRLQGAASGSRTEFIAQPKLIQRANPQTMDPQPVIARHTVLQWKPWLMR